MGMTTTKPLYETQENISKFVKLLPFVLPRGIKPKGKRWRWGCFPASLPADWQWEQGSSPTGRYPPAARGVNGVKRQCGQCCCSRRGRARSCAPSHFPVLRAFSINWEKRCLLVNKNCSEVIRWQWSCCAVQLAFFLKLLLVVPLAPGVSGDKPLALGFWGKKSITKPSHGPIW